MRLGACLYSLLGTCLALTLTSRCTMFLSCRKATPCSTCRIMRTTCFSCSRSSSTTVWYSSPPHALKHRGHRSRARSQVNNQVNTLWYSSPPARTETQRSQVNNQVTKRAETQRSQVNNQVTQRSQAHNQVNTARTKTEVTGQQPGQHRTH